MKALPDELAPKPPIRELGAAPSDDGLFERFAICGYGNRSVVDCNDFGCLLLTAAIFACRLGGILLARPPAGVEVPELVPVPARRKAGPTDGVDGSEGGLGLGEALPMRRSPPELDATDDKVGTAGADAIPRSPFSCVEVDRL